GAPSPSAAAASPGADAGAPPATGASRARPRRMRASSHPPDASAATTARITTHDIGTPCSPPPKPAGLPSGAAAYSSTVRRTGAARMAQHEPVVHAQHPLPSRFLEAAAAVEAHVLGLVGFQVTDAAAAIEP